MRTLVRTALKTNSSSCRQKALETVSITSSFLWGRITGPGRSLTPLFCSWRTCECLRTGWQPSDVVHLLALHKPSTHQFSAFMMTHNHCLSCNRKLIPGDAISYNAINRLSHVVFLLIGCMMRSRMALFRWPAAGPYCTKSRKVSSETCNSVCTFFVKDAQHLSPCCLLDRSQTF